jgi:hypothetical protein
MRTGLAILSLVVASTLTPSTLKAREFRAPGTTGVPCPGRRARPPLRLVWLDVTGAARGLEQVARAEARTRLEPAGRDLVWREGRGGERPRRGEIFVNLIGRHLVDRQTRRPILGASSTRPRPNPVVWAHVPSVCAALGQPVGDCSHGLSGRRRHVVGVALGRVVAHEIVHALAPSLGHSYGLMSEMLTRSDLMAPSLGLDARAALAVRRARPEEWALREASGGGLAPATAREGGRPARAR